jgi:mannosyltransferase OCH1-like enzyme
MYRVLTYLRYLLLIKYGGIYVDADYECLDKIDAILENQTIDFGLEPEKYAKFHQSEYFSGNCFMASIPEHPFLNGKKTNFITLLK